MKVMKPRARNLILDLMSAAEGRPISVREAIFACALFGIRENNVRVALVRLAADRLLESAGRGLYRLGPLADELAGDVATWRHVEQRVRPWQGDYLVVHSGPLGRSDRAALRRRQRALSMLGFRELEPGLFVRPNNIEDGVDGVRQRLYLLGLERDASVFVATDFDAPRVERIVRLWDARALNAGYRRWRRELDAWLRRADRLEPEVAARESFRLGGRAIRDVVFDPLLPAPMVDIELRNAFVASVRQFDAAGKVIWARLMASVPAKPSPRRADAARRGT